MLKLFVHKRSLEWLSHTAQGVRVSVTLWPWGEISGDLVYGKQLFLSVLPLLAKLLENVIGGLSLSPALFQTALEKVEPALVLFYLQRGPDRGPVHIPLQWEETITSTVLNGGERDALKQICPSRRKQNHFVTWLEVKASMILFHLQHISRYWHESPDRKLLSSCWAQLLQELWNTAVTVQHRGMQWDGKGSK